MRLCCDDIVAGQLWCWFRCMANLGVHHDAQTGECRFCQVSALLGPPELDQYLVEIYSVDPSACYFLQPATDVIRHMQATLNAGSVKTNSSNCPCWIEVCELVVLATSDPLAKFKCNIKKGGREATHASVILALAALAMPVSIKSAILYSS